MLRTAIMHLEHHGEEFATRFVAVGTTLFAMAEAISTQVVQAWVAVLIGAGCLLLREYRAMRRLQRHDVRLERRLSIHEERISAALKIIYDQNEEDLRAGKRPRHSEFAPKPLDAGQNSGSIKEQCRLESADQPAARSA